MKPPRLLFEIGHSAITVTALAEIGRAGRQFHEVIWAHLTGDWDMTPDEIAAVNEAIRQGNTITTRHRLDSGVELTVSTSADRHQTTVAISGEHPPEDE